MATDRVSSTFERYYRILVQHAWLILMCVAVGAGGAIAYVKTATVTYTAEAQMLVSPVPADNTALIGLPVLHSSGDPTRDVLTAASLIASTQVAAAVVNTLHLQGSPNDLLTHVQATPIGQSNLVAVQVQAQSAAQAQAIANAFVGEVVTTRAAALHTEVAFLLPGVTSQATALPPSQRAAGTATGDQLIQLQQLRTSKDPTITIAALASRPTSQSSPRTKLTLIAAVLGALILGIGAAFGLDALDPRIRQEEQLREVFEAPILARIPRQRRPKTGSPILPQRLSFAAAEGYRTLRTILNSRAAGKPRSVLVTGSTRSEGKTTSAINVAVALAQGGSSVILLEADLRRPSIAMSLGLELSLGVDDVLMGDAELADVVQFVSFGTASLGLLAVRRAGAELADHLSLSVAERLVREAMSVSNFLVIDSPPLTAVSDALPLAQLVDDVLVVARLGSSKLSRLWELRDLLVEQQSSPTGIILIGDSARSGGRDYYDRRDSTQGGISDGERTKADAKPVLAPRPG